MARLDITEYSVNAGVGRRTFAFVSDLHCREFGDILSAIRERKPEAVLVGGDFTNNKHSYEGGFDFLRQSARYFPTYASVGNHEMKLDFDFRPMVRESGAILLDDSYIRLGDLLIGGLTSGFSYLKLQSHWQRSPAPNMEWLGKFEAEDGFKLLLSHHPEYYEPYLRERGIDLILSGHAHGGQWRLGKLAAFAPGQGIFPRYTAGIYENRLLVSRGLGNTCGFPRIFNAPELIFLTLQ